MLLQYQKTLSAFKPMPGEKYSVSN